MKNDTLSLNESLLRAAADEQWEAVKQALDAGADVNAQDDRAYTVLYRACVFNAPLELVRQLLESGADIRHLESSILRAAVRNFNFELLELLLSFGADINASADGWHDVPLCEAVEIEVYPETPDDKDDLLYVQMIEFLLNAGANASAVVDTLEIWPDPVLDAEFGEDFEDDEPTDITVLDIAAEKLEEVLGDFLDAYEEYCDTHGDAEEIPGYVLQEDFSPHYYRLRAYERGYHLLCNSPTNTMHDPKGTLEVCNVLKARLRHVLRAFR